MIKKVDRSKYTYGFKLKLLFFVLSKKSFKLFVILII